MNLRNALLGTTAVMGAAALAVPSTASAFDVNINGFMNFNATMGDTKEALGQSASSFDFVTDTEIHVQGVQTDDETGIRYGMTVEFEADLQTSNNNNIDEAWIFIDGSFGGIRLGNEDGIVDNSKLGAYTIAAGTGGIDGQGVVGAVKFAPVNSGDSTKARYYSPTIAGFSVGVSYTPNGGVEGNQVADTQSVQYTDMFEGGLVYSNSFGSLDLLASAVGIYATGMDSNTGGNNFDRDDYTGYNFGAVVGFAGFEVAGSYWGEQDAPAGNNANNSVNRNGFTAGAAASFGPADLSVTYAKVTNGGGGVGEGDNVVLSASMGLLPGMALQGDVSWFDRDAGGDDDGVTGVARVRVAF
ncbi:MAG: porin [Geminicoccaceae bacterium]